MAKSEEERIDLCEGKYTVILNNKTGQFRALRYGDEWRDLSGDKLILSMFGEIITLKQRKDCTLYTDFRRSCQALKDRNKELKYNILKVGD